MKINLVNFSRQFLISKQMKNNVDKQNEQQTVNEFEKWYNSP